MRPIRLYDELPTKQEQQCRQLGDFYIFNDDEDEPAFGADPFDILVHREEIEQSNHD